MIWAGEPRRKYLQHYLQSHQLLSYRLFPKKLLAGMTPRGHCPIDGFKNGMVEWWNSTSQIMEWPGTMSLVKSFQNSPLVYTRGGGANHNNFLLWITPKAYQGHCLKPPLLWLTFPYICDGLSVSLADPRGGARDAPPLGVQILSFSCSFRQKCEK